MDNAACDAHWRLILHVDLKLAFYRSQVLIVLMAWLPYHHHLISPLYISLCMYILRNTHCFALVYDCCYVQFMILFFIHFLMWTMEYQVGKDVAQCLNEALAGSGLNVRVTALVGCFDHFVTCVPTSVGSSVLCLFWSFRHIRQAFFTHWLTWIIFSAMCIQYGCPCLCIVKLICTKYLIDRMIMHWTMSRIRFFFFTRGSTIILSFSSSLFVPRKLIAVWLLVRYAIHVLLNLFLMPVFPKLSMFLYLVFGFLMKLQNCISPSIFCELPREYCHPHSQPACSPMVIAF